MLKRCFDIVVSFFGLIVLSPLLFFLSLLVIFTSRGGAFFKQVRVGKNNIDFVLFKFRTMYSDSDKTSLLTVGQRDNRITKTGYYLRKYKLDELPQLFNVLLGDMSLVGPRPEVKKYVSLYNKEQKKVLTVKPGITDSASLEYFNENELLAKSENPEYTYIHEVMPAKLELNKKYIQKANLITDVQIILKTIYRIFS